MGLVLPGARGLAAPPAGVPASPAAPLRLVADVPLPGPAVRFDYQSLDTVGGRLYISHMNADQLLVFDVRARKVVANLDGFPRVRGVWVVPQIGRVYAAARASHEVVVVDTRTLETVARVGPVPDPDGIAYAPRDGRIFVSDERSKADAVIDAKTNRLVNRIAMGGEAGNTVYDPGADRIVVAVAQPPELAVVDPATARITSRLPLPGRLEPHGVARATTPSASWIWSRGSCW